MREDMRRRSRALIVLPLLVLLLLVGCGDKEDGGQHPNIVFIVIDDAGIDKWSIFGYGGLTPPSTPNIDTLALGGVRFRNVWAMPECSASRASMFTGRYPLRTGVLSALTSADLA